MPTEQIVALLIAERDKLNRAIEVLQGPTKRRGRPPKNLLAETATAAIPVPAARKRRQFSAAQRGSRRQENAPTVGCEKESGVKGPTEGRQDSQA
jgi:hypothetical protein